MMPPMTATSTKTRARLACAALAAAALLAGCNAGAGSADPTTDATDAPGSTDADDATATGPVAAPPPDGSRSTETVRIGLVAEPASLDFTTTDGAAIPQLLLDNVYETLVTVDADSGEIVPMLAQEWEVSDDRLTYTFTLVDGVTFSDGAELTA